MIVTMIIFTGHAGYAQDSESIFKKFEGVKDVDIVNIRGEAALSEMFQGKKSKVESVKILEMEDCSQAVIQDFSKEIKKLKNNGFETLLYIREDGDIKLILAKEETGKKNEFLVIVSDDSDLMMIRIKGDINLADLAAFSERY